MVKLLAGQVTNFENIAGFTVDVLKKRATVCRIHAFTGRAASMPAKRIYYILRINAG